MCPRRPLCSGSALALAPPSWQLHVAQPYCRSISCGSIYEDGLRRSAGTPPHHGSAWLPRPPRSVESAALQGARRQRPAVASSAARSLRGLFRPICCQRRHWCSGLLAQSTLPSDRHVELARGCAQRSGARLRQAKRRPRPPRTRRGQRHDGKIPAKQCATIIQKHSHLGSRAHAH